MRTPLRPFRSLPLSAVPPLPGVPVAGGFLWRGPSVGLGDYPLHVEMLRRPAKPAPHGVRTFLPARPPQFKSERRGLPPAGRRLVIRSGPRYQEGIPSLGEPAMAARHVEDVEMTGHIIDSLLLPKVLDAILTRGA